MNAKYLKVEIADKVATVTIHRPDKRNALSPEVLNEGPPELPGLIGASI